MPTKSGFPKCSKGTRRSKVEPFACLPKNVATKRKIKSIPVQISASYSEKVSQIAHSNHRIKSETRKKLQNLLNPTAEKDARLGKFLSKVCYFTPECIALGKYEHMINEYFDNFRDLKMINIKAAHVLSDSGFNGRVLLLEYVKKSDKQKIFAYTVLKSIKLSRLKNKNKDSSEIIAGSEAFDDVPDNLVYKYIVGKHFVNKLLDKFPNFVKTYGLFSGKYELEPNNRSVTKSIKSLKLVDDADINWKLGCKDITKNHIMTQYFTGVKTLSQVSAKDLYYSDSDIESKRGDAIIRNILFQVYFPLMCLRGKFSHDDLHAGNILMYSPLDMGEYIEFNYHFISGRVVTFPCEYIPKMIDYGRCFFESNSNISTAKALTAACNEKLCGNDCGYSKGLYVTNFSVPKGKHPKDAQYSGFYPYINNSYVDLKTCEGWFENDAEKIIGCNVTFVPPENMHEDLVNRPPGTYDTTNGFTFYSIIDYFMPEMLDKINDMNSKPAFTQYYDGWTKAAIMHIYEDGRDYTFDIVRSAGL